MIKSQKTDAESQLDKIKTEKTIQSEKSREFSVAIQREKTKIHWAIDKMIKHHNCTCHRCKVAMCKANNFREQLEKIQKVANSYTIAKNRMGININLGS